MKEILIIRPQSNQLGDTICTLPMFKAIKDRHPESKITLVGCPTNYDVEIKKLNPYLDDEIIYSRETYASLFRFVKTLRRKKYDLVLVPSSIRMSYTSYVIALLAEGRIKAGVGRMDEEKNRLGFILDIRPEYDWNKNRVHQVERFLDSARAVGCGMNTADARQMRINLAGENKVFAEEFISSRFPDRHRKIVCFHPGAGQKINVWNTVNYFELIKKVSDKYNPYILLSSGVIDSVITDRLETMLMEAGIEYRVMSGLSVFNAAAVLSRVNLFVSGNTGIMHLASYSGAKTLGFFFRNDAFEWHQYFEEGIALESPSENINEITVEEAFENVCSLL